MDQFPAPVTYVARIMQDEFGEHLEGVLWTGSRVNGRARMNSDWDFFVIHDGLWRQRRLFEVAGDEVELFINPADQIRREYAAQEAATIGMFAEGRVVLDVRGTMQTLVQEARQRWMQAPLPWTAPQRDQWRYEALDLLKDVEDVLADDPDSAAYLMGLTVQKLLEGYYRLNGYWEPKAKYILPDVAAKSPNMAFKLRMAMGTTHSLTHRYQALRELVESVQKPLGGYLREWQTVHEAVQPWRMEH